MNQAPERISRLYTTLCRSMELYVSYCYKLEAENREDKDYWTKEAVRAEQNKNRMQRNLALMLQRNEQDELSGDTPELITPPILKLAPQQAALLQTALLAAFDEDSLRQMIKFGLGFNLDQIAGGKNLKEQVFNLITWSEQTDRQMQLIMAAQEANPSNEELKALTASHTKP